MPSSRLTKRIDQGDDPFVLGMSQPQSFTLGSTFPNGFDMITEVNLSTSYDLLSIFESDQRLFNNFEPIEQILKPNRDFGIEFLNCFQQLISTDVPSIHNYDDWTLFALLCQKLELSSDICLKLLSTQTVFNPRFSIFGNISDQLNTLRSLAFEFVIGSNVEAMLEFVSQLIQFPLLYAESAIRLHRFSLLLINHPESVIHAILESLTCYRGFISYSEVVKARTAIVIFIHDSFQSSELQTAFLSNSTFAQCFTGLSFEIFIQSLEILSTQDNLELALELLRICHQFQLIHQNYGVLRKIITEMCLVLVPGQSIESYQIYLLELLLFLYEATNRENFLKKEEIKALKVGILQVYPTGLTLQICVSLMRIATSRRIAVGDPNFVIRQPLVFILLISLMFETSSFLIDILDTMHKVITASRENPLVLQLSGFDTFLLKQIRKTQSNIPISHLLPLVSDIRSFYASETLVARIFSFLKPINNQPNVFHENILQMITQLLSTTLSTPLYPLALLHKTSVPVSGISVKSFEGQFSWHAWICLTNSNQEYAIDLFSMRDQDPLICVTCQLQGTVLIVMAQNRQGRAEKTFQLERFKNQWILLSIIYINKLEDSKCRIFVNGNHIATSTGFLQIDFSRVTIHLAKATSAQTVQFPLLSFIGSQMLFSGMSQTEFMNLFEFGPRKSHLSIKYSPVFCFTPNLIGHKIVLQSDLEDKSIIDNDFINGELCGFTSHLTDATLLLPFLQWTNVNSAISDMYFIIISQIFQVSIESQNIFLRKRGFGAISFWLMNSASKELNFHVYQRLYLMKDSIEVLELLVSLFHEIVLNSDLWFTCDFQNQSRILRHWMNAVFPSHKELFIQLRGISSILEMIRTVQSTDLSLILCQLLTKYNFGIEDTRMLINCIFIIQNETLKSQLCAILMERITTESIPDLFLLLNDNMTAVSVIEFLICHCQVEDILDHCGEQVLNHNSLHSLVDFINLGNPSVLPIACWIAMNLKDEGIKYLIQRTKMNQNYYFSTFSLLWPTCLLFSSKILNVFIVEFLFRIFGNYFDEIYGCIEILGTIFSLPDAIDDIKACLLVPILNKSALMMDFLTYRRQPYFNQELRKSFMMLDLDIPFRQPSISLSEKLMPRKLYAEMTKIDSVKFCFGMRVNKNVWTDVQLAKSLFGPWTTAESFLEIMTTKLQANELPVKLHIVPTRFLPQLSGIPPPVRSFQPSTNVKLEHANHANDWSFVLSELNNFFKRNGFV